MYRAMMIFWLTCLVGYPRTSAPEPEKHFQELANRELFSYDNVKKQVVNLMSHEKGSSVSIWLLKSRVASSAAFESYIELLSRKSAT